jgi:hypothetical protein
VNHVRGGPFRGSRSRDFILWALGRRSVRRAFLCPLALGSNCLPRVSLQTGARRRSPPTRPPMREHVANGGARDNGRAISRRGLSRRALSPTNPSKEASPQPRLRSESLPVSAALTDADREDLLSIKQDATKKPGG